MKKLINLNMSRM
jgi:hypothetical protein